MFAIRGGYAAGVAVGKAFDQRFNQTIFPALDGRAPGFFDDLQESDGERRQDRGPDSSD
jgi:hypothetical protein